MRKEIRSEVAVCVNLPRDLSHYFETALDLTFCVPEAADPSSHHGFYAIMAMGSEQVGLTGFKGSIVRKVAVDRSASSLRKSLTAIKDALEND